MPFQIIRNDITRVRADVIVNTANPRPVVGRGTDSAVYAAAGEELLLAERKKIGDIARGQVAVTPAFGLPAKYIIHTVGPSWDGGNHGERETLHSCYANSLAKAAELGAESIAFPLIATGVYGFPKDEALNIALAEIGKFLLTHEMMVTLVVFDRKSFELSGELVGEIREFIDEHGVGAAGETEYGGFIGREWRRRRRLREEREAERRMATFSGLPEREEPICAANMPPADIPAGIPDGIPDGMPTAGPAAMPTAGQTARPTARPAAMPQMDLEGRSLEDVLGGAGETFQQRLFKLIDDSGLDDVTVYKRANIDRKVFSRIRSRKDYRPKKRTAIAFAIALELDLPTMKDLLSRAGFAFSPSDPFDLIIAYFVTKKNYDILQIDAALFQYGQPTLFSEE